MEFTPKQALEGVTQQDLADLLDVSRNTLHKSQRAGMPFRTEGRENRYSIGAAAQWQLGRKQAKALKLRPEPLETWALGYVSLLHSLPGLIDADDRSKFAESAEDYGWSSADALQAFRWGEGVMDLVNARRN